FCQAAGAEALAQGRPRRRDWVLIGPLVKGREPLHPLLVPAMDKTADNNLSKPTIYAGDLTKPPVALRPLLVRPQWAIWRLEWTGNRWTNPPFQACNPQRHASIADPSTWTDYATAVAAAAEHGDGVSYILTPEDNLAAADIDHVRDPATGAITEWAQRLLEQAE